MQVTANKRSHRTMPEMVNFLLGGREGLSTHAHHRLYLPNLLHFANQGYARYLRQARASDRHGSDSDVEDHFEVFMNVDSDKDSNPELTLGNQRVHYSNRGPHLSHWPLYFYCSGIGFTTKKGNSSIKFGLDHPQFKSLFQYVKQGLPLPHPHLEV
jgi:hypothetical protein